MKLKYFLRKPKYFHLGQGAEEGEEAAEEVEDHHGVWLEEGGVQSGGEEVEQEVEVGPEGEPGVVLPGLETLAVQEVVGWLPVVEGLVTVRDPGPDGRAQSGRQEQFERRGGWRRPGLLAAGQSHLDRRPLLGAAQLPPQLLQTPGLVSSLSGPAHCLISTSETSQSPYKE